MQHPHPVCCLAAGQVSTALASLPNVQPTGPPPTTVQIPGWARESLPKQSQISRIHVNAPSAHEGFVELDFLRQYHVDKHAVFQPGEDLRQRHLAVS